ncbi:MAG: hypothetical protein ACKOA8_03380 [Deltaproteobacteria bacterium]
MKSLSTGLFWGFFLGFSLNTIDNASMNLPANFFVNAREVLALYLIPIGGGIPAGVLLAKSRGLHWTISAILYFISDVILAFIFEPLMLFVMRLGKNSEKMARVREAFRQSLKRTTAPYGHILSPLSLIAISFGVDPMTGRSVAKAAGHGFVTGWLIAITGDMFYFLVIMSSTLWLNNILGNGTWTVLIILVLMMGLPTLIRRLRIRFGNTQ